MSMPNLKQILKGEVGYSLEDFYNEFKNKWGAFLSKKDLSDQENNKMFKNLFMFILLSSEDKPMLVMAEVFNNMPEDKIKEGQEAFKEEIDVARHIQMKKYLDLFGEYMGGMDMTLRLLDIWLHEFLDKYIKEENKNDNA